MKKDLQQNLNSVFTMKKTIFLLLVFLMVSTSSFATTYYSRATGDWNSISTWSLTSGGVAVYGSFWYFILRRLGFLFCKYFRFVALAILSLLCK